MKPLAACVMMSYEGRSAHGPVWPKPERLATIEPRMLAAEIGRRETPARQRAAGEVLDQDVEVRQQAAQQRATLVLSQVERDALLAAVEREEEDRHAVDRRIAVAPLVAALRRLDLHHLGAQVGEDRGAERPGEKARQVEDPDARERAHRGRKCRMAESSASRSA